MVEADLPHIATLNIGGARGPEGWTAWNRENYARHGFGLWVIETPAGEFVGDCGLTVQEVQGEWLVEAGWHVRPELRRQGFAAEAAEAVRRAAEGLGVHKHGGPALIFGADMQPRGTARSRIAFRAFWELRLGRAPPRGPMR